MSDLDEVFVQLASSASRQRFKLATREREYMRPRGKGTILAHARGFIAQRLAPAHPANDGKQTPFRGCLAKWHGIPTGRVLTAAEQDHVVSAIERWLDMQGAGDGSGIQQSLPLL
jgi:hypothetical protein